MSNLKLLRTILRLKSLQIAHFRFMHRDTELHLAVKPYKNGCRCPACGRRGRIVHQTTELRRWEDVAVMGLRIVLWYAPKEVQCPTHGRVQEEIPWAPPYARVTYMWRALEPQGLEPLQFSTKFRAPSWYDHWGQVTFFGGKLRSFS